MDNSQIIRFWKNDKKNSAEPVRGPGVISRDALMKKRLPLYSKLSIILTDKCNITCRHCMPSCTPKKSHTLQWEDLQTIINTAATIPSIKTLCFTGGEAFLYPRLLEKCVALAAFNGLESTVISNAFWATSVDKAKIVLNRLPGLTRLGLSTDSFHQEFIKIDRIRNAILAAEEIGLDCAVRVCYLDNPDEEIEEVRRQLIDVKGSYELEHQPVQPLGRAEEQIDPNKIFSFDTTMACCTSADTHAINPNGVMTACCGGTGDWPDGHPLELGRPFENGLANVLNEADSNLILHAVRLWGPAGLLQLARQQAEAEGNNLQDPGINNICGLCKFLVADKNRAALLRRAVEIPETRKMIALARLTELGEIGSITQMEEYK